MCVWFLITEFCKIGEVIFRISRKKSACGIRLIHTDSLFKKTCMYHFVFILKLSVPVWVYQCEIAVLSGYITTCKKQAETRRFERRPFVKTTNSWLKTTNSWLKTTNSWQRAQRAQRARRRVSARFFLFVFSIFVIYSRVLRLWLKCTLNTKVFLLFLFILENPLKMTKNCLNNLFIAFLSQIIGHFVFLCYDASLVVLTLAAKRGKSNISEVIRRI
jgi:uncharacterized membrane protein YagU involved in acid resistance